jgi:hypothetical protein
MNERGQAPSTSRVLRKVLRCRLCGTECVGEIYRLTDGTTLHRRCWEALAEMVRRGTVPL